MKKLSYVLALGCMMCASYEAHALTCKNTVVRCEKDGVVTFKGFPTTYYFMSGCSPDNPNAVNQWVDKCQNSGGAAEVIQAWTGEDRSSGTSNYLNLHEGASQSEISLFQNALG